MALKDELEHIRSLVELASVVTHHFESNMPPEIVNGDPKLQAIAEVCTKFGCHQSQVRELVSLMLETQLPVKSDQPTDRVEFIEGQILVAPNHHELPDEFTFMVRALDSDGDALFITSDGENKVQDCSYIHTATALRAATDEEVSQFLTEMKTWLY